MNIGERIGEKDILIQGKLTEDSTSPRNLKKLTATFKDKLHLNNNQSSAPVFSMNSGNNHVSSSPTVINQRTKRN